MSSDAASRRWKHALRACMISGLPKGPAFSQHVRCLRSRKMHRHDDREPQCDDGSRPTHGRTHSQTYKVHRRRTRSRPLSTSTLAYDVKLYPQHTIQHTLQKHEQQRRRQDQVRERVEGSPLARAGKSDHAPPQSLASAREDTYII